MRRIRKYFKSQNDYLLTIFILHIYTEISIKPVLISNIHFLLHFKCSVGIQTHRVIFILHRPLDGTSINQNYQSSVYTYLSYTDLYRFTLIN